MFPLLYRSAPGLEAGCPHTLRLFPDYPGLAMLVYGVAPVSSPVHLVLSRSCPGTSRWHPDTCLNSIPYVYCCCHWCRYSNNASKKGKQFHPICVVVIEAMNVKDLRKNQLLPICVLSLSLTSIRLKTFTERKPIPPSIIDAAVAKDLYNRAPGKLLEIRLCNVIVTIRLIFYTFHRAMVPSSGLYLCVH